MCPLWARSGQIRQTALIEPANEVRSASKGAKALGMRKAAQQSPTGMSDQRNLELADPQQREGERAAALSIAYPTLTVSHGKRTQTTTVFPAILRVELAIQAKLPGQHSNAKHPIDPHPRQHQ